VRHVFYLLTGKVRMYMDITIRKENQKDYRTVEELTREAFWNIHIPGCNEHYILHLLRNSPDFIPELSFVAEHMGQILGHIVYSRAVIRTDRGEPIEVVCFGPISVLPYRQRNGIGSALIRNSLDAAKKMGYRAVCIYGDPRYYSRFGFRCAERYDIRTADGLFAVALLALELEQDALSGISGRFTESSVFEADLTGFDAYDQTFPQREKTKTETQREFKILASLRY
jgi:predicted N-acetyltransferase YhbS